MVSGMARRGHQHPTDRRGTRFRLPPPLGLAAIGLGLVMLSAVLVGAGLDRADKIASVLGLYTNLGGTAVAVYGIWSARDLHSGSATRQPSVEDRRIQIESAGEVVIHLTGSRPGPWRVPSRPMRLLAILGLLLAISAGTLVAYLHQQTAREVPCGATASGATIQNHDSRLNINNADRPRVGNDAAASELAVPSAPPAVGASAACVIKIVAGSGDLAGACMQVVDVSAPTLDVVWRPCTDVVDQVWNREFHFNDGQVQWERLHAVRNPQLCLQQAAKGEVGVPLIATSCDGGWLQQWKVSA